MRRGIFSSLLVGVCCFLLVLGGCGSGEDAGGKSLRVGTEPAYPPMEFQGQKGELQGFSIDLMNAVGSAAGFKVNFQSVPFDGLISALQARTIDAAISSMTITKERAQAVSFSRPYFKSGLAIAIRTNNQDITSFDKLNNQRVAVQIGTTGAAKAKEAKGAQIRTFDSTPLALQELANGNVDAMIGDAPVIAYAINSGNLQGIKTVQELLTEEYYGIPTPKDSTNLKLINQGLTKIFNNGTYAQIYQKWFKTTPPKLPESLDLIPQADSSPNSITVLIQAFPLLLQGALITLQLTIFSVFLGLIVGSLIGIARLSHFTPLGWAARAYIDFFRGTPLLVQLFMIYYGIPAVVQNLGLDFSFNRFAAAVVALSLNSAAYIAEIVRAGIQSIEIGQSEAAKSLGFDAVQTMCYVIFPQAFRRMLPPLGNEFISMLKDTSLVAVISFDELFRKGQLIVAQNYRPFEIYAGVAIIYLCLTLLSSQMFSRLETWMNPVKQK
ncbi:MAG: ABC transporter permease subunit [Calothrix sp. C42_A2020_038]|nr:ABC transporter permease subunit [Calothrix sp. C42_A2020_038]